MTRCPTDELLDLLDCLDEVTTVAEHARAPDEIARGFGWSSATTDPDPSLCPSHPGPALDRPRGEPGSTRTDALRQGLLSRTRALRPGRPSARASVPTLAQLAALNDPEVMTLEPSSLERSQQLPEWALPAQALAARQSDTSYVVLRLLTGGSNLGEANVDDAGFAEMPMVLATLPPRARPV